MHGIAPGIGAVDVVRFDNKVVPTIDGKEVAIIVYESGDNIERALMMADSGRPYTGSLRGAVSKGKLFRP